jgi:predicted glycoside hydrolase/deacetylase ChbG (UPF0249 family)
MAKYLIFNADDLGLSTGVNRGIMEAHGRGIVTSASLMVTRGAVEDAVLMLRDCPELSIGLHWDISNEGEFDLSDPTAVRVSFRRQVDRFEQLLGRLPTHIDSHHHVHRDERVASSFQELVKALGMPLRGDGRVACVGGFYAQWEYGVTNLEYVGVPFLQQLLREEVGEGWTEIACHPGYVSSDLQSIYSRERETELETVTDARIPRILDEFGIRLKSYADYARIVADDP